MKHHKILCLLLGLTLLCAQALPAFAGTDSVRPVGKPLVIEPPTDHPAPLHNPFKDLAADLWYYQYALKLNEKGYMTGTSADTFSPKTALTRGMLVTILHRMAGTPAAAQPCAFSDVAEDDWFAGAVSWASEKGYVNGMGDGTFAPQAVLNRQQLCAILWRYAKDNGYDVSAKGEVLPTLTDRDDIASWAAEAMSWAMRRGLVDLSRGSALPTHLVTRGDAAGTLGRFMELPKSDTAVSR